MTDPDPTPILTRIDRQLHAIRAQTDPAKAVAAYRAAALNRIVAPELTENTACDDCTQELCTSRAVFSGRFWRCTRCGSSWVVEDTVELPDPDRHWRIVGFVLAVLSAVALIAVLWPFVFAALARDGK